MAYQLRPCSEEDRDWAYALKSEAYREVVERQFGPWDEKFQRGLFEARWNPGISRIILVGGIPIGLLAVEDRGDHLGLDEIQIARDWRGKGIGTAILHEVVSSALIVRLQVLKKNARAQEIYHRLAFSVVAETETHFVMEHRKLPHEKRA